MFILRKTFFIKDFWFDILIPIRNTNQKHVSKNGAKGSYTITDFEKDLQNLFNVTFNELLKKMVGDKKDDIVKKLKAVTRNPVKFRIQKVNNNYLLVFNIPFPIEITSFGNFSKIFKREQTIKQDNILAGTDNVSASITEIVYPLSVIELHCNIAEYSYSNHDNHPHIDKQEELLYISLIDNNFYESPVYKETCTKIVFVPLRKGLREIREIVLALWMRITKR